MTLASTADTETERAPRNVGEAVVQALVAQGCRHVFGLPGSHTLEIYGALSRQDVIRHVTVKNESTVSFMADFYGRLTRRPGVCLLTAGPGAINSVNGVAQAYSAHSPMLHITGAVPEKATLESFHGVDDPDFVRKMFEPITKWSVSVKDAAAVPAVMAEAYRVALSGRPGPVHVEFPRLSDTLHNLITDAPGPIPPYGAPVAAPETVDLAAVEALAAALGRASSPVIISGKGVLATGAGSEIGAIAHALGAPIIYDQEGIGAIPDDNPYSVGYMSVWSLQGFVKEILVGADVVLAAGVRPGTGVGVMLANAAPGRVTFVDWAPSDRSRSVVVGHVRATLKALQARLRARPDIAGRPVRERIRAYRQRVDAERRSLLEAAATNDRVHPGTVIDHMVRHIGERPATFVSDIGECSIWLRNYLPNRPNLRLLQSGMWGSMGCAVPGSFVAKLLEPERVSVGVVGDGALLMTSGDLGTYLEHGANAVLIVLNDGKYQQISRALQRTDGTEYGTTFENPDYAALAASFGARGFTVRRLDQLDGALSAALASDRLAVINVHVQVGVPYPSFEFNTRPPEKA